ncbi:MAG: YbaY family lipoprotein [Sphaerochaetaceae bacterium]|nr:YbaY family lipoprotein [Sphaerochaetaceae bacterium]
MKRMFLLPTVFTIFLVLFGCSLPSEELSPSQVVPYSIHDGVVSYPDNLYFPSRVTLTISMYGETANNGTDILIVSQQITNPQRFPVNYTLRYLQDETESFSSLRIEYSLTREGDQTPYMRSLLTDINPADLTVTRRTTLTRIR